MEFPIILATMNELDFNKYVRLISLMGSKTAQGVILRQGSRLNPSSIALAAPLIETILSDQPTPPRLITQVAQSLLKNAEEGPSLLYLKDAAGQSRPYYGLLAAAVVFHAHRLSPSDDVRIKRQLRYLIEILELMIGSPQAEADPAFFACICYAIASGIQAGVGQRDAQSLIHRLTPHISPTGWLCISHSADVELQPDLLSYREIIVLHCVYSTARLLGHAPLITRAHQVALMHMEFTQTDYFTNQPWGLACFLSTPETIMLGEQQLNDCSIIASQQALLPGHPPGAINALILADAWITLNERPVPLQ
jgi:hypothetical protein